MKILFSSEYFNTFYGGWERSQSTLLKSLANEHEIHSVFLSPDNSNSILEGINLHQRKVSLSSLWRNRLPNIFPDLRMIYLNAKWRKILQNEINVISPDLIMTELNFAPSSIETALKYRIPTIFFVRSYEHFCPIGFIVGIDNCDGNCWRCIYLGKRFFPRRRFFFSSFINKILSWHRMSLNNADLVLANSRFMMNVMKKLYNVDSKVVYPFIDLKQYHVEKRKDNYITFVGPAPHKGVDIFIKIAKKLNKEKFLVCGGSHPKIIEQLLSLKNVKYIPWVDDMRIVYSQTKLLLVPSVWPEPFGRVAIEAMVNGIPCVVSDRGGLPEAVGDSGIKIKDIFNIDEWLSNIKNFEDENYYSEISKKGKKQAEKFDFNHVLMDFNKIINQTLDIDI